MVISIQELDERSERHQEVGIPKYLYHRFRRDLALKELDHALAQGAIFRAVLTDAGYSVSETYCQALDEPLTRLDISTLGTEQVAVEGEAVPLRLGTVAFLACLALRPAPTR